MKRLNCTLPQKEVPLFAKVVKRAETLLKKHKVEIDRTDLRMDLLACHLNGCPLDWQKMIDAPDFDFLYDIGGIRRYINRENGQLEDFFHPRCAHNRAKAKAGAE